MDAPIRPSSDTLPPDIQSAALEELNRLEARLDVLKGKLEILQPIHLEVNYSVRRVKETIETLEAQIATLRQGQMVFEVPRGDT